MRRKGYFFLAGMFSVLLAFVLIMTGCPDSDANGTTGTRVAGVPIFVEHPTSFDYAEGATPRPLRVVAKRLDRPGMGELGNLIAEPSFTYRWYSVDSFTNEGGTPIAGATSDTFTPTGEGYFYVVVTNPSINESRASHPARIRIGGGPDIAPTTAVVNITTEERQYIRAFGGMSNGFYISSLEGETAHYMERRDIETMFDPEHPNYLGFKILRKHIFPATLSDVLSGVYGPEGMRTSNAQFVDFARRVSNFGGYVVAAPWTPMNVEWKMHPNLYGRGNHINPAFFREYAMYLRDWAAEMAALGGPIYAISIQNEPTYGPDYYGMLWTSAHQRDFMRQVGYVITGMNNQGVQVGPGVRGAGGGITGRYITGTRTNQMPDGSQRVRLMSATPHQQVNWNNDALNDPEARIQMEIVGYHTYGNWNNRHSLSLDNEPRRETWMMEKNVNTSAPPSSWFDSRWDNLWIFMHEIHHVIAHNDTSVYNYWYIKRFYSAIGCGTHGTINNAILARGHGMSHFALYLTDTVRLHTTGEGFRGTNAAGAEVDVSVITNVNQQSGNNPAGIRLVAGTRRANPPATYTWNKLKTREDLVTAVLMDSRQYLQQMGDPTEHLVGQYNDVRVNLPSGFTATAAHGIISAADGMGGRGEYGRRRVPVLVVLEEGGESAVVRLPANSIVSLAFNGVWN